MPRAAAVATPNELNPAISAAASAGTICSGSVVGSSWVIDAARIPIMPAISEASRVLTSEITFGDSPPSIAATSFSDAALVASPNRVHLYSAASAIVRTITMPVRMNLSTGITAPSIGMVFCGARWAPAAP